MREQQNYRAAIYCRLSSEDGPDHESMSIGNQRSLLLFLWEKPCYIMYFNPVDVNEESTGLQFTNFITAYLQYRRFPPHRPVEYGTEEGEGVDGLREETLQEGVCEIVKSFRRLTINPGFLLQNDAYLTDINWEEGKLRHRDETFSDLYNYYIDRQYELCLDELGYH